MNRAIRWLALAFLAAAVLLGGPLCPVRAQDKSETRDFEILVDGKQAGRSQLTIVTKDNGTTLVKGTAKVQVQFIGLITAFSYSVTVNETWKGDQLVELQSSATEDGKKTNVEVTAAGDLLRVRINGRNANNVRPDVWTSSYWKLADAKYHNKAVPILDADTGKEYNGQLQYIGTETLKVGAKAEDCYHFRVTGTPVPIDLWFDRYHRLVRQEFTESGHKTLVQLIGVRR